MITRVNKGLTLLLLLLLTGSLPHWRLCAQTAPKRAASDRLGMTCAQILSMSSAEWIMYFGEKTKTSATDPAILERAVSVYTKCYDARTDALAASFVRRGKEPSKAARADFADFEEALRNFTTKALADPETRAGSQKASLAALYEKQFRYLFYQQYAPKVLKPMNSTMQGKEGTKSSVSQKTAAASGSTVTKPTPETSAANETDEMTKAKNRFGELLGALPDERLHELHAAFGEVIGVHALDNEMRLAVYRYAVFLLEPSTDKPTYPPPF